MYIYCIYSHQYIQPPLFSGNDINLCLNVPLRQLPRCFLVHKQLHHVCSYLVFLAENFSSKCAKRGSRSTIMRGPFPLPIPPLVWFQKHYVINILQKGGYWYLWSFKVIKELEWPGKCHYAGWARPSLFSWSGTTQAPPALVSPP